MKENKQKKKPNKKNKKSQEDLIKIAKAVCIILVVLMLLFVAADRFGNITFSSVGDYFSGVISGAKSGDGHPAHGYNESGHESAQPPKEIFQGFHGIYLLEGILFIILHSVSLTILFPFSHLI